MNVYIGILTNIENSFPIFNSKCPILKNLAHFRLKTYLVRYEVLNNIYNNIDCLPNLKYFELYCFTKDSIDIFYIKFIIKLLSLNIDEIYLRIKYERQNEEDAKIEGDTIDYEKWIKKFDLKMKNIRKKNLKNFILPLILITTKIFVLGNLIIIITPIKTNKIMDY